MGANRLLDLWKPTGAAAGHVPPPQNAEEAKAIAMAEAKQAHTTGTDLACSACKWAAKRMLYSFSKIRTKKPDYERTSKIRQMFPNVCKGTPAWPQKFGLVGEKGEREFVDEKETMGMGSRKASSTGMKKDHENAGLNKAKEFCDELMSSFADDVANLIAGHNGRIGEINFERWLCFEQFQKAQGGLCAESQVMKGIS